MRNGCTILILLTACTGSAHGDFVIQAPSPFRSVDELGDSDNESFTATYSDPTTLFGSLSFSGVLTEDIGFTEALEAQFSISTSLGSAKFQPDITGQFPTSINVDNRTWDTLFWLTMNETITIEAFELLDDGSNRPDANWTGLAPLTAPQFTFGDENPTITALPSYVEGSFTLDNVGTDFNSEIALFDENGTLIGTATDGPGTRSTVSTSLAPGNYYAVLGGFNSEFASGAAIAGTESGMYTLRINNDDVATSVALGERQLATFSFAVTPVPEPSSFVFFALIALFAKLGRSADFAVFRGVHSTLSGG